MSGEAGFQANLQRGELLRHQGRYAEAESYLQRAIGEQPDNADGYYELAFCYCNWSGHSKKALAVIDRAISLEPNRSECHALRAWILGNLDKNTQAVEVAAQALELNPFSLLALNAQTRAYIELHDWKQAEANARQTLSLNARNELAANLLAVALRQQGRLAESDAVTAGLLAQVPENAMAQSNAGWSALQLGDHRRANQHFLEALRLDPDYDYARRGLLHSFNSRVWIYRFYFQFIAWLGRYRKAMRYVFAIVIYIVYRFVVTELSAQFGEEGLRWALVLAAIYLVILGFGRSFANLFLLLDRFARYALTRKEKGWSLVAGSIYGILLALLISEGAWPQAAVLIGIVIFFLWGVLVPRFQDIFLRKSSVELVADEPASP
jgi:tetratricopeptide (TPR) repeat protein